MTEQGRGLGYRHFTENIATLPYNLGFGYFIYFDQPVTGRSIGGESHNFGLVNQQDQPYYEMLAEVTKSNTRLFDLHAGKLQPFVIKKPRTILGSSTQVQLCSEFMPDSVPEYVSGDFAKPEWYHDQPRLKIDEAYISGPGNYYFGTIDLHGKNATTVEVRSYFWDQLPDISQFLLIEESGDNRNFKPVKQKVVKGKQGTNFTEYLVSNEKPFTKETRYIRIGVHAYPSEKSWVIQYCGFKLIGKTILEK